MTEIRNCEFRFKCSKLWDSLDPTGDDKVRFCGQAIKHLLLPSCLQSGIGLLIDKNWTTEQAVAVVELLDDLR